MRLQTIFKDPNIDHDEIKNMSIASSRFDILREKKVLTDDEQAEIKNLAAYLGINL